MKRLACSDKFGVEDGRIPDLNMSSSSARGPGFEAYRGRLNNLNGNGSWCANMSLPNNQQYLRIDLGEVREVSAVETQGNPFPDVYHFDTIREVNCRYNVVDKETRIKVTGLVSQFGHSISV
ncbi:predicted protein [Nematostella vectensis]|uniref:F5/8 type C domain-containing protein n=1 Tax=Nematostella vectensis TaxID=45351 RepID=A7T9K5_NEMVE|nr:predicted protein [Nematostella vectensis]|eukprot:XP_001619419.1 hypothetical protein NEMVEDRAFT_v1g224200 [Nematostella vectensis]